jgi:hypothetical protein
MCLDTERSDPASLKQADLGGKIRIGRYESLIRSAAKKNGSVSQVAPTIRRPKKLDQILQKENVLILRQAHAARAASAVCP